MTGRRHVPSAPDDRGQHDGTTPVNGLAWVNGRIGPIEEAMVPAEDPGFLLGHGVFETMRAEADGPTGPHLLDRHLGRLTRSAGIVGIDLPLPIADLRDVVTGLVTEVRDAPPPAGTFIRIRLTVTAGGTTVVTVRPAPEWPATTTLALVDAPIDERNPLRGAKTISHLDHTLARLRADELGVGEIVRTDHAGHLAEGSASNLFLVLDGRLVTPALTNGCLPGITRELVLESADVEERADLLPADLERAEEIFVTSSTRGVHPVRAVDGRELPAPGPVTGRTARAHRARLGLTTGS